MFAFSWRFMLPYFITLAYNPRTCPGEGERGASFGKRVRLPLVEGMEESKHH